MIMYNESLWIVGDQPMNAMVIETATKISMI